MGWLLFDWSNWEMWGAIGQWLGALATTAAVVIALREVFTRDRIPLNVSIKQHGTGAGSVIELWVANLGSHPITIREYGIVLPNEKVLDRRIVDGHAVAIVEQLALEPKEAKVIIQLWTGLLVNNLRDAYHLTGVLRLSAYVEDPMRRRHYVDWKLNTEQWKAHQLRPWWAFWRR